jgi:phosphatidylinositol alpha-1,6-mannosyltransferase
MGALATHATGWSIRVVTLDHGDAISVQAPAPPVPTRRVAKTTRLRRASVARLNLATLRAGLDWRPDAVVSGHLATSPGAILLARLLDIPTVQYAYAKELADRPGLGRFAITRSAATIVLSEHAANMARHVGADAAHLHVVAPGVDVAERAHDGGGPPTILTVARLADRYKGFDVMLRAMPLICARVPAVRWVVIGDGPLRSELERTARAWELEDSVVFCGQVSDDELDGWFGRSHVFAMPSRLPAGGGGEGYGLVYLEAAARGLPCVAGDAGASAEAVVDGETGLVVDATDHVQVAGALVELLSHPDRAARLGAAGQERARTLSWERMAKTLESVLAGVLASRA